MPLLEHAVTYCEGKAADYFARGPTFVATWPSPARAGLPKVTPTLSSEPTPLVAPSRRRHRPVDIASLLGHKDSRMVERVCGRMDAHSLGRALHRRLGASEATNPPPTTTAEPQNACSICSKHRVSERTQTPQRTSGVAFSRENWCPGTE
jgi:hypothetical protein